MRMFPTPKAVSSNLRLTDGLTVLAGMEIITILVHYQPSYNTSHTQSSDPLLLANVTLHCGMYPTGKFDISRHLAIPGFPQSDHTFSKPSADAGSLCSDSRPPDLKSSSASHLLGLQGPQQTPSCPCIILSKLKKTNCRI